MSEHPAATALRAGDRPPVGGWPGAGTAAFRASLDGALAGMRPEQPGDLWRDLGAAGIIRQLCTTPADGRLACDTRRLDVLLRELDARFPLGAVLSVCVQAATVLPLLAEAVPPGSPPGVPGETLRRALRGEAVVALAVTDAAASGSDVLDATTTARLAGGRVTVDGGKRWITNATHADHALVLARHREARHFTSFCWVLVPVGAPGVTVRPATGAMFAGAGVGHLDFDGVHLDATHVAGRPGRALASFAHQIGTERLAGALWARAMCRRVLRDCRDWLAHRPAGGGTLWDNAAVRERFARCLVELARLDALCAPLLDAGPALPAATSMLLKAAAGECVDTVLGECAHLRGADAFRDGGEAALRAEAAMFGIAGGATGAMLAGVAEHADELLAVPR